MAKRTIIIREHDTGAIEVLTGVPGHISANEVVEKWQKATIHYQVHGTLPAITWKVAENPDLIAAIIEGATL